MSNNKKNKDMAKLNKEQVKDLQKRLEEKGKKARSKWAKAVCEDASWLLENVLENMEDCEEVEINEKLLLNGAENWKEFSYGGSAYAYDGDIAEHYCTPSELKKVGFGKTDMGKDVHGNQHWAKYVEKQPNPNEEWLDVQARALRQAWWLIRDELNGTTEFSMSLCNFSYQDVEGHYAGTENFKVIENNKDRLVLETDTMRSVWTFDGNNVVKYETTDKTSGKKIESKDSTSYFKKSQGLTEEYKGNEKIATFKTPKRTYTYDFKVGKLIDEKGNPANAKDMGKLLSNESSEVCDNIRKSVNQIEDELKKYGHLKMAKKDEVFATIKDSLAKTNFSGENGLKYRKTKGQGKDSYKGKKSNFSIDYICEETCDLADFPAWSGAKDRLDKIIELGIEDEAEDYIKEMFYGETPTDTQINDLLWFDMDDWIEEHREHKDNFKIFNIEWDETDIEDAKKNDIELPTELELEDIEIEDRDDVESSLSDAIYDEVGYSPNSFEYESESGNFSIKSNFEINDEQYDYKGAVKDDVLDYIHENYEKGDITEENRDEIEQSLDDDLFVSDRVTGNASGSYTFNTWKAESYLCHNLDLLMEAMEEFGCNPSDFQGAEWGDVTIRCYLLRGAISEAIDEFLNEDDDDSNMSIYELSAQHDARKSFYGKAQVDVDDKTGIKTLYSYGTKVAEFNPKTNKFTAFPEAKYSATTKRHVREFMKQNGVPVSQFSIIDDVKKGAKNIDKKFNCGILMF